MFILIPIFSNIQKVSSFGGISPHSIRKILWNCSYWKLTFYHPLITHITGYASRDL
ncbi:unnamed protein product [Hymenolepis diminuta]|uniref:Uncharacterized protein n=1 Tax=Hymenolepis diminuta TaxID=6216 RepID=A0A564YX90_HYMDI|nr:unnamed protein product [Hymenolepis diminuta]